MELKNYLFSNFIGASQSVSYAKNKSNMLSIVLLKLLIM